MLTQRQIEIQIKQAFNAGTKAHHGDAPLLAHPAHRGPELIFLCSVPAPSTGEQPLGTPTAKDLDVRLNLAYRLGLGVLIGDFLESQLAIPTAQRDRYEQMLPDAVEALANAKISAPMPESTERAARMVQTFHAGLFTFVRNHQLAEGWHVATVLESVAA